MNLEDLEIYKLSREISRESWEIYKELNWEDKRIVGYQFITAIDSIGANIAEGFGRFHFLDKNRFNYNSRGSLLESIHWLEILIERKKVNEINGHNLKDKLLKLHFKLNNYINSTKGQTKK